MRVVLDANVIVSALINANPLSPPKRVLDCWRDEVFLLLVSEDILTEISRVLRYPRIRKRHQLTDSQIDDFMILLADEAILSIPQERLHISPDQADNRYLECAVAGGAQFIVTGDHKHLLPIGEYRGIKIIPPSMFLLLIDPRAE